MEAIEIFTAFKAAFPNNKETFDPTDGNIARWNYHLKQLPGEREKFVGLTEIDGITRDMAVSFFQGRKAETFKDLNETAQSRYLLLASIFPGRDIYACGSWVMGEYIHSNDLIFEQSRVLKMRELVGRSATKTESDFDFWIALKEGETRKDIVNRLPSWADFLRHRPATNESLTVPGWDFSKLPETEHQKVIDHFTANEMVKLMEIHNAYELSPVRYCCDSRPVKRWFKWAIEEGIIKPNQT